MYAVHTKEDTLPSPSHSVWIMNCDRRNTHFMARNLWACKLTRILQKNQGFLLTCFLTTTKHRLAVQCKYWNYFNENLRRFTSSCRQLYHWSEFKDFLNLSERNRNDNSKKNHKLDISKGSIGKTEVSKLFWSPASPSHRECSVFGKKRKKKDVCTSVLLLK